MHKLVLLLTCLVGLTAARVLDVRTLREQDFTVQHDTDLIERMSQNELQRQKFILEVLQRVQEEPINEQIIRLGQGLVEGQESYVNGIDAEMQRIIELARQGRLLSRREQYTTLSKEHVRQMSGIYRLLVRSADFETLQRNIATLRVNVNGVLLTNAIVLALRDRDDTQMLIVPAMPEILPELFIDEDVLQRAQNLQTRMLSISEVQTKRPNLLDLIGLGRRNKLINSGSGMLDNTPLWMPWRDMRLQMATRKLSGEQERIAMRGQNKLVIPLDSSSSSTGNKCLNLLTEDIGLKSYVQELINTLGLLEGEHVEEINMGVGQGMRMGQQLRDYNIDSLRQLRINDMQQRQSMGLSGLQQRQYMGLNENDDDVVLGIKQRYSKLLMNDDERDVRGMNMQRQQLINRMQNRRMNMDEDIDSQLGDSELPTSDINNARLLHINRRRLNQDSEQILGNGPNRFMHIVRGGRVSDGRRTVHQNVNDEDDDESLNVNTMSMNINRSQQKQQQYQQQQQQQRYKVEQQLPMTTIDNSRLLHVNRRRLQQNIDTESTPMHRFTAINEGRHVDSRQQVDQENDLNDDDDRYDIKRGSRVVLKQNEDLSTEDLQTILRQQRRDLSDDEITHLAQLIHSRKQARGERLQHMTLGELNNENINDNERLLHVNRRRLSDDISEQEELDEIRNENKIKRLGRNFNDDDMQDMHGRRIPRSIVGPYGMQQVTSNNDRSDVRKQRIVEVLLHNLQQLTARINLEQLSVCQQDISSIFGQQTRNPILIETIQRNVERRLGAVIKQQLDQVLMHGVGNVQDQEIIDRVIGNVIAGRLGNVSLLDILRDVVQQTTQTTMMQGQQSIGSQLSNPNVLQVLNSVVAIIDQIRQEQLNGYERDELELQGVTINDVSVDQMRTYIDESDVDLVNALNSNVNIDLDRSNRMQKMVVARQQRLNHKNFNIDMDITATGNQPVVIRTLLGPKTDVLGREVSLNERRKNFIVLDTLITNLQPGRNRITRNSRDIIWTTRDTTPYTEIYQRVMSGLRGEVSRGISTLMTGIENSIVTGQTGRLPERLLLPRGRVNGLPMQLLVIVTPAQRGIQMQQEPQTIDNQLIGMGIPIQNLDNLPLGFPFDRKINNERQIIDLPNVKLQDVVIYHEK